MRVGTYARISDDAEQLGLGVGRQQDDTRKLVDRARDSDALDMTNRAPGGAPFDHAGWMAEEIPFNADQRTWERADVIVCGTPQIPHDPGTEVVVAPPSLPAADDQRG
jgi:hypothetical protein